MGKEFDTEPIYNNRYLKTKIKSYDDEAAKVGSNYTCLAAILLDFVPKKMKTIVGNCF